MDDERKKLKSSSKYCHVPDTLITKLRNENSVVTLPSSFFTNQLNQANCLSADNCRITQNEIVPLISFLFLDAANRGIMPNNSWTEQFDNSLAKTLRNLGNVSIISAFLHERFVPLLSTYMQHDIFRFTKVLKKSNKKATIGWQEILPMIQSLYCLMWRASKPERPGSDEFVSAELDREIIKQKNLEKEHYYVKLQKINTFDPIAATPTGWQYTMDITGGYYTNISSRKTSEERPTNIGQSFA